MYMIDTIMLLIQLGSFNVLDKSRFSPNASNALSRFGEACRCYQNASKAELKAGIYKPKLNISKTIVNGGMSTALLIEFSIPKLIFGNNFEEVTEEHFDTIIQTLQDALLSMAVEVAYEDLVNAKVVRIQL